MHAPPLIPAPTDDARWEPIDVEVVIEVPRGSFLKRGSSGHIDFVSPLPCPYNYGAVPAHLGLDNDLLDALVLGPRLRLGKRLRLKAWGAAGLLARLAKEELQQRRELKKDETAPLLNAAVEFFTQLRDRQPGKKPSTAELIDWVNYLVRCGLTAQQTLADAKAIVERSLGILAKSEDDLGLARQLAHERL